MRRDGLTAEFAFYIVRSECEGRQNARPRVRFDKIFASFSSFGKGRVCPAWGQKSLNKIGDLFLCIKIWSDPWSDYDPDFFRSKTNEATVANRLVYKNTQTCKPGSVSRLLGISIIYLPGLSLTRSSNLPLTISEEPENGPFCIQAYLKIVIYLVLQPIRGTADCVTTTTGELLPRLFTRSRSRHVETRWSFSVTLLQAFARLPVKKHGALRCPDFPLSRLLGTAIERSALQRCQNCRDMQTNEIKASN